MLHYTEIVGDVRIVFDDAMVVLSVCYQSSDNIEKVSVFIESIIPSSSLDVLFKSKELEEQFASALWGWVFQQAVESFEVSSIAEILGEFDFYTYPASLEKAIEQLTSATISSKGRR